MQTEILMDLGFTNAETKVYLALLELGTATAGPILEKTGLQNSVVHRTLNSLIEKGFISFVKEGKKNHYQSVNPKHLLTIIDEKRENFETILPELLAKQRTAKKKPEIFTFKGIKGIRELLNYLLEAGGKQHHTFGSTKQSLMLGEPWWINYHKKRAKKGIKAKLLFNDSLKSWKPEIKYSQTEVRYTKVGFEPLTETIIRNNKVGIILWTDKPIGVLIHHKTVADSYNGFFNMLWGSA